MRRGQTKKGKSKRGRTVDVKPLLDPNHDEQHSVATTNGGTTQAEQEQKKPRLGSNGHAGKGTTEVTKEQDSVKIDSLATVGSVHDPSSATAQDNQEPPTAGETTSRSNISPPAAVPADAGEERAAIDAAPAEEGFSLVEPEDIEISNEYATEFMESFIPWIAREEDVSKYIPLNHRFLMCRWCCAFRTYRDPENFSKSFNGGVHHLSSTCQFVPPEVKEFVKSPSKQGPGVRYAKELFKRINAMDADQIEGIMDHALAARGDPPPKRPRKVKGTAAHAKRIVEKTVQIQVLKSFADPNTDVYQEETAFLFHNPPTEPDNIPCEESVEEVGSIPPPPPLPTEKDFPTNSNATWSIDPHSRVLLGNFTQVHGRVSKEDLDFLGRMMERDDLTVISEGIFDPCREEWLNFENLATGEAWSIMHHHKFKRFVRDEESGVYIEKAGMISMQLYHFFQYLNMRKKHWDLPVPARDEKGKDISVIPNKDVVYCLDLDITRYLAGLNRRLEEEFKIPNVLPGGEWCSLRWVPQSARNFMGPNLYICPPGGFTQFHQDGRGTVDSGHYVVDGYNEVIMLRRLPQRHKQQIMSVDLGITSSEFDKSFALPHSDQNKAAWPSVDLIESWCQRNYCPSVFILKPGQMVHINKGRLHAFRKMGLPDEIVANDCHYALRSALVKDIGTTNLPTTVSIAWDWQYLGVTKNGIHRETTSMLESQFIVDSQPDNLTSLATSQAALLALGSHIFPTDARHRELASGIWPALKYIIEQELECLEEASTKAKEFKPPAIEEAVTMIEQVEDLAHNGSVPIVEEARAEVHEGKKPIQDGLRVNQCSDQEMNPRQTGIDPFGEDYTCRFCKAELHNSYFHCFGCEMLLQQDFNYCRKCYKKKEWKDLVQMGGSNQEQFSDVNHVGCRPVKPRRCPTGCFLSCPYCDGCFACACICHSFTTVHTRYFSEQDLKKLKEKFEKAKLDPVSFGELTQTRLDSARDRQGAGRKGKGEALKKLLNLTDIEYPKDVKIMVQIDRDGTETLWDPRSATKETPDEEEATESKPEDAPVSADDAAPEVKRSKKFPMQAATVVSNQEKLPLEAAPGVVEDQSDSKEDDEIQETEEDSTDTAIPNDDTIVI